MLGKRLGQLFKDPDVKRSLAYLVISLTVSTIKSIAEYVREKRNEY